MLHRQQSRCPFPKQVDAAARLLVTLISAHGGGAALLARSLSVMTAGAPSRSCNPMLLTLWQCPPWLAALLHRCAGSAAVDVGRLCAKGISFFGTQHAALHSVALQCPHMQHHALLLHRAVLRRDVEERGSARRSTPTSFSLTPSCPALHSRPALKSRSVAAGRGGAGGGVQRAALLPAGGGPHQRAGAGGRDGGRSWLWHAGGAGVGVPRAAAAARAGLRLLVAGAHQPQVPPTLEQIASHRHVLVDRRGAWRLT
jgi:hypothetical protein